MPTAVLRFTMEHIPEWYKNRPMQSGKGRYFAPHFRSDREWYDNTVFHGELKHYGGPTNYQSINQTWPLGTWIDYEFKLKRSRVRLDETPRRERVRL